MCPIHAVVRRCTIQNFSAEGGALIRLWFFRCINLVPNAPTD
jgi:hypothetical protein